MQNVQNPIIVALDLSAASDAQELARAVAEVVGGFKIGSELFTHAGPEIVRSVGQFQLPIFLDLKFHDIPNTVAKAVSAAAQLGVQMMTVHCSGGLGMLQAAEDAAHNTAHRLGIPVPLVLGVTVLTSFDTHGLREIGCSSEVPSQVERLADLAVRAGLRGLVCSPWELARLRKRVPGAVQLVTPGIRAATDPAGDQKRTLSAPEAIAAGANWLVIGRPIYAASDPRTAAENILESLKL